MTRKEYIGLKIDELEARLELWRDALDECDEENDEDEDSCDGAPIGDIMGSLLKSDQFMSTIVKLIKRTSDEDELEDDIDESKCDKPIKLEDIFTTSGLYSPPAERSIYELEIESLKREIKRLNGESKEEDFKPLYRLNGAWTNLKETSNE